MIDIDVIFADQFPEIEESVRITKRLHEYLKAVLYREAGEEKFTLITTSDFDQEARAWAHVCLGNAATGDYSDFKVLDGDKAVAAHMGACDIPPAVALTDPYIRPLADW